MNESQGDALAVALERLRERLDAGTRDLGSRNLADQLEVHYRSIASSVAAERNMVTRLRESIQALSDLPPLTRSNVELSSRFPGGRFFHRVIGKMISRHTEPIYHEMRRRDTVYRSAMVAMAEVSIYLVRGQNPTVERRVSTLADRMTAAEAILRSMGDPVVSDSDEIE